MLMALPEILTRKLGPLPGWAWGGLGLGLALAVASWQRNKADSAAGDGAVTESYALPESLQPTYVFQNYDQDVSYGDVINVPGMPPAGGRPSPPTQPRPTPIPSRPPATGGRKPPTPIPGPPPAPSGRWETVSVPWKAGQPPATPSTIWGIAEKVFGVGKVSRAMTERIWSSPQNAQLRQKRGRSDQVRVGDKVWVPL